MSDEDQSQQQPSGQEQRTTQQDRPQGERSGGGSNAERGSSGGLGVGGGRHGGGRGGRRRPPQQQQQRQQGQTQQGEASFNMKELRELVELFTTNGLTDFELENEDIRVRLSRNAAPQQASALAAPQASAPATGSAAAPSSSSTTTPAAGGGSSSASTSGESGRAGEADEGLYVITAPIVGTFYRSPSPNAESFVRVGSRVEPDSTVCIIEAMKLMNEIQSEMGGVVEKIYVENGQAVEYGQPLFDVRK